MDIMMRAKTDKKQKQPDKVPASTYKRVNHTATGLVDNRSSTTLQFQLAKCISHSPQAIAQRLQIEQSFGNTRQGVVGEEPLQSKFIPAERNNHLTAHQCKNIEKVGRQQQRIAIACPPIIQGKWATKEDVTLKQIPGNANLDLPKYTYVGEPEVITGNDVKVNVLEGPHKNKDGKADKNKLSEFNDYVYETNEQLLFDLVRTTKIPTTDYIIPYFYPLDGCHARAALYIERLHQLDYAPSRAFIMGSKHKKLKVDTNTADTGKTEVSWGYHVAPILESKKGMTLTKKVYDPSLFSQPKTKSDWAGEMGADTYEEADSIDSAKAKMQTYQIGYENAQRGDKPLLFETIEHLSFPPYTHDDPQVGERDSEKRASHINELTGYARSKPAFLVASIVRKTIKSKADYGMLATLYSELLAFKTNPYLSNDGLKDFPVKFQTEYANLNKIFSEIKLEGNDDGNIVKILSILK